MRHFSISGIALAMACAQLPAQTLYRCGNEYRDTPCPNAITLDARDPRTPAQSAQAERQIAKDAALAQQMETARLQAEAAAAKRLQAQAQREAAQEKKRLADAKALERAQHSQEALVLKPNKKQRDDVFTVRSPKPPKNTASAAPPPKSP
jgi:hypothetical protein